MDNFFRILIGDEKVDNNQPATPASIAATGDDKSAISEAVLAGASVGQLAQQSTTTDQPTATHAAIAEQTDITPSVEHAPTTLPVVSSPIEPEKQAAEVKTEEKSTEIKVEEIKPVEEVIAKVETHNEDTNAQEEAVDSATTDAAEHSIGKLGRKLQMKIIFSQAVATEFGLETQSLTANMSPLGVVNPSGNVPQQKTQEQSQDALVDKLTALRDQLSAEVKPAVTPPSEQSPSPIAPSVQ